MKIRKHLSIALRSGKTPTSSRLALEETTTQADCESASTAMVSPVRSCTIATGTLLSDGTVQDLKKFASGSSDKSAVCDSTAPPRKNAPNGLKAGSIQSSPALNPPRKQLDGANLRQTSSLPPCVDKTTALSSPLSKQPSRPSPLLFKRTLSSFLRVADLDMEETETENNTLSTHSSNSSLSEYNNEDCISQSVPNFHHSSVDPPPGIAVDPKEKWIVLDNGVNGQHAPLAPLAVNALAKSGFQHIYDESMWTPADSKTQKLLSKSSNAWPATCAWQRIGNVHLPESSSAADEQEIMVWSGSFRHGLYGSELPAIRSAGIIDMSPQALTELLADSTRIQEYNKLSLGRTDLLVLQSHMNSHLLDGVGSSPAFGGITKVVRAVTKPPLVRKPLVFTSIIHVRELDDGSGFKIVTRAVKTPDGGNNEDSPSSSSSLSSEILLGVNIIKRIHGNDNRCLMMCVNHIRSPMVPMMVAKRIGLSAAVSFYHDLRACC